MAAGRPVVASAVGGIPEIITDGVDGLLVPPGRPDALADAVTRLLRDEALRRRLGDAARAAVVTRFGPRPVATATAAFYESLVA
jgi:glycosyltransferase involved in cell wall biosynthesis